MDGADKAGGCALRLGLGEIVLVVMMGWSSVNVPDKIFWVGIAFGFGSCLVFARLYGWRRKRLLERVPAATICERKPGVAALGGREFPT